MERAVHWFDVMNSFPGLEYTFLYWGFHLGDLAVCLFVFAEVPNTVSSSVVLSTRVKRGVTTTRVLWCTASHHHQERQLVGVPACAVTRSFYVRLEVSVLWSFLLAVYCICFFHKLADGKLMWLIVYISCIHTSYHKVSCDQVCCTL